MAGAGPGGGTGSGGGMGHGSGGGGVGSGGTGGTVAGIMAPSGSLLLRYHSPTPERATDAGPQRRYQRSHRRYRMPPRPGAPSWRWCGPYDTGLYKLGTSPAAVRAAGDGWLRARLRPGTVGVSPDGSLCGDWVAAADRSTAAPCRGADGPPGLDRLR